MSTDKQGSCKKKTDMGINSYDLNINKKEFRNEWGGFSPLASNDCVLVYERPFYVTKKLCKGRKYLFCSQAQIKRNHTCGVTRISFLLS